MFYLKFGLIQGVKISATIIAFNEEKNISAAVKSLDWADEILVVDSGSTDNTSQIAESLGVKVLVKNWEGFAAQKQFAVESAAHDWIFSLDADERVSEELKKEILKIKNEEKPADGYRIPRRSFYMNRWIKHSGWYPDWQLRLFNRQKGVWKKVIIHESIQMKENASVKKLKGDILHYGVENASQHHRMIGERYAPLAAEQMFANGKRTNAFKLMTAGLTAFLRVYFLKAGFLDGLAGFSIASFAAHHAFLKHLLLLEMQKKSKSGK